MAYEFSDQAPIGSGFGLHTTAVEVLDGIDLTGKLALVTGGYSGIGIEMVRSLVAAGAEVLAPARRPDHAREALEGIAGVTVGELDLADQASVAAYAEEVLALGRHLDLVINSAGVMATPEQYVGPGWELQLATNHLGHFALINRLWPLLGTTAATGGSRVVSVSSGGHQFGGMRWDDLDFARDGYDKWLAYGQSKTANVLFAVELDRRGAEHGVRAFALHPGAILTPLGRHLTQADMEDLLSYGSDGQPLLPEFKSPEEGAATAVWAAASPMLGGLGGLYLEDCEVTPVANPEGRVTGQALGVMPHAKDPEQAERLWAWSAEQTGVDAFA
jgi:NAD(P)-dependent dehydrogenase (short-subunit alcohol dehydrogenase family)